MSTKDKLTTDNTQEERERVRLEQDYIKQKGRDVASVATKAKDGSITVPSTDEITTALQHGQESLERLQSSDRGRQMGQGGDKVVEDIKRVLADQQVLVGEKNQGDVLQSIVRDFWALLQELKQNTELKVYFEEWQGTVTSVFSSGDFSQFFQQTADLFTSLKDTDEFLSLATELIDLMKIVVAESTEKVVEGDSATKEEYRRQREMERHRVARELRYTLSAVTRNEMWRALVHRSKAKASQLQGAREASSQHADDLFFNLRESANFQRLLGDFKVLLQRLVGPQLSVDPLFQYSKRVIDDIFNDQELSLIVDEMQRILPAIAEDTTLLDDPTVQRQLDSLSRRADDSILRLRNDPNVNGVKDESIKVAAAIKNETSNITLLTDLKTLWRDLTSGKSGEVIDPDVLKSLRQMIVPLLVEHLNNVPLPSVSDEASFLGKYFYTIDEMKISLPELIPENIHLRFEYEMDANPLELEAHNQHTFLYVQASNLQLHLHDCHFTYERRTLPKHSDSGIFDVDTVGEGLTAWLKMEIKSDATKGQYLDVLKSDVKISKFRINFRDSKHDHLYEMLTHLFSRKIRTSVIDMLQNKLKNFGSYFNTQIIALLDQAKTSSGTVSKIAREKTEQARQGVENLKLHAKETKEKSNIHETKEDVKSTAKLVLGLASEKVQEQLDSTKVQLEQQRRSNALDRAIADPSAAEILNRTPTDTHTSLAPTSGFPPVVSPALSDAPIPFSNSSSLRPSSPSILSNSSSSHLSYGSPTSNTPFNAASHSSASGLPSESAQFSPHFASPSFAHAAADLPAVPRVDFSKSTLSGNSHHHESSWVSAKPEELAESKLNSDLPSL